jgi:hypothetical protein
VKYELKLDDKDYQKNEKITVKNGETIHTVSLSVNVDGIIRMIEDGIISAAMEGNRKDVHFFLEEHAKYWVMRQAGIKTYPLPPKKR